MDADPNVTPGVSPAWAANARARGQAAAVERIAAQEGAEAARSALNAIAEHEGRDAHDHVVSVLGESRHSQAS